MTTPDPITKIRKQDFKRYVDVQRSGRFNMLAQADAAARLAGLKDAPIPGRDRELRRAGRQVARRPPLDPLTEV